MEALECIKTRRSVRSFLPDPISRETLTAIVDAGRLAATARNVQPWEFVVVTDAGMRKKLAEILEYGKFIAHAPACIVVLSEDTKYYLEDGCAATENILLAAHGLGVGSCWVAGDKKPYADEVRDMIGALKGFKLVATIALGKSKEAPKSPSKRTLEDVTHWEKF